MEKELWADVEGYYGLYQVSTLGRMASYDRLYPNGKLHKGRIKKLTISNKGYLRVTLVDWNGSKKGFGVARLVATMFIPNQNNLPQVNHKNGDKIDNRVENLEWVTASENVQHAFDTGLKTANYGFAKLTEAEVHHIKLLLKIGKMTRQEIADHFGVRIRQIFRIQSGARWGNID